MQLSRTRFLVFMMGIMLVSLGAALIFSKLLKQEVPLVEQLVIEEKTEFRLFEEQRHQLDYFVSRHMMRSGLVVTNLQNTSQSDLASGQDLLSESVGLLLLYYLETNQKTAFDQQFALAVSVLQKPNHLFQWRTREGQPLTVNASVDDLRILKALLLAEEQWGEIQYRQEAEKISQALLSYCTEKGWLLEQDSEKAVRAKAFYYDFKAMYMARSLDRSWEAVIKNGLALAFKDRKTGSPNFIKVAGNPSYYPTTENLVVYWHLTEVGYAEPSLNQYLKDQLAIGLYGEYDEKSNPLSEIQSPAIYGLAALIGKQTNDPVLYELSCRRLSAMQVTSDHPYKGGFVNLADEKAYSFDQLIGLLAY